MTASAPSLTPDNFAANIPPSAFARLQVLLPGETADPGRPSASPLGKTGNPSAQNAGNPVNVTVNAVDNYYNLIAGISDAVTFTTSDPSVPPQGTAVLVSGTANHAVTFYTPGNQNVTATDLSDGTKNGTSSLVTVLGGVNSTLLNFTHASPPLSTGVFGQSVTLMVFQLRIQSGTNPAEMTSLALHSKDSLGADIPLNSAFQNLTLVSGAQTYTLNVSGVPASTATLGPFPPGTFTLTAATTLPVTLIGDILNSPSAANVQLFVDAAASVAAQDSVTTNPMGIVTQGDPTGFPMSSNVLALMSGSVAGTFGNYPNPFRAGMESTTIEFYLPAASTVSFTLYDVMGGRVGALLDHQLLGAGLQRVPWDGKNGMGNFVVNGIYYGQLEVDGSKYLVKIAVVK